MTAIVMLQESRISIASGGNGTKITKTLAIMPIGKIRSDIRIAEPPGPFVRGIAAEAIRFSECVFSRCRTGICRKRKRKDNENVAKSPGRFFREDGKDEVLGTLPCSAIGIVYHEDSKLFSRHYGGNALGTLGRIRYKLPFLKGRSVPFLEIDSLCPPTPDPRPPTPDPRPPTPTMAGFKTHITVSSVIGIGYGAAAYGWYQVPPTTSALAAALCGVSGMLPDLDSGPGVPLRESCAFAAAVVPMLLLERFEQCGMDHELIVLAGAALYFLIRFGLAWLLRLLTEHRGMFHSIPTALIFGEIAFLLVSGSDVRLRLIKAGAVVTGFLSHLLLDELYSIEWSRGFFF